MEQKETSATLQNEWMGFNANIGTLYTFFENLDKTADKLDLDRKKAIVEQITTIFGNDPDFTEEKLFGAIPSIDDLEVFPDIRKDASYKDIIGIFQGTEFEDMFNEWGNLHPHKSQKFARVVLSLYGNPPMSGIILRKSMFIMLLTFLEVLIETIHVNHQLLQGFSKDEARKIANKNMKGNWEEKLNKLDKAGIPNSISSLYRDEILGIIGRRNLFVHNDGVVDDKYLSYHAKKHGNNLKEGELLVVSTNYLRRALNVIFTYGFLLCQSHWRTNDINEKMQNDQIDHLFINSFDENRFSLILELSEKIHVLGLPENFNHRILANRAIAFRELENHEEVNSIIAELKSLKHDWQIDVAIFTLEKNYTALRRKLLEEKEKHDIRRIAHWPLFNTIKNEPWFKMAFTQKNKVNLPNSRKKH